ncbi:MAG: diaminopimelate epimerase [Planctomycetota bacterium]
MRFTKMHGAGNDYVLVDLYEEQVEDPGALARAMTDRRVGVGADGLLLLGPPDAAEEADISMEMLNPDGSRAEMCGNGLRCLAKFAYDNRRVAQNPFRVATGRGVLEVSLSLSGTEVTGACVNMGPPILDPEAIPALLPGHPVVEQDLEVGDETYKVTCVSMGNPHCVIYVDDVDAFDVESIGAAIETHELFPRHTNVEFVQIVGRSEVKQRTWERGAGETLACGTGACAVGVAGVLTGRTDPELVCHVRGGDLQVKWDGKGPVFLSGPAVQVFEGVWDD